MVFFFLRYNGAATLGKIERSLRRGDSSASQLFTSSAGIFLIPIFLGDQNPFFIRVFLDLTTSWQACGSPFRESKD